MMPEKINLWERRIVKTAVALAVVTIVAVAGAWTAFHELAPEKVKNLLETTLTDFLGRKLTIEDVSVAPFPKMEMRAHGVKLVDRNGRVIVDCPEVTAHASVLSVLKLHVGIEEVLFLKPEVHLWYERDGRLNVEKIADEIAAQPAAPGSASPQMIFLHRFTIKDGRLTLADVPGAPPEIDGRANGSLTLKFSPMGLRGIPFELDVDEGEKRAHVEIKGAFGKHPTLQVRGERVPARALSPRLTAIGNCAGAADLRLDWDGGDKPTFDFGISPHGLCREVGSLPERISGKVKRKGKNWDLEFSASGKDTALTAKGSIPPAPQPMTFEVTGASASVESVSAWGSAFNAIAAHANGPAIAPSSAPARVFAVKVAVASATFQGVPLSNVNFDVNGGTNNVVWIRPLKVNVFNGNIEGASEIRKGNVYVDLHGHDLSLAAVAEAFGSTGALRGLMSVALAGDVPIGAPVVSSFTGHVEVWMDNFELDRVPAILKVITSASFVKLEQRIKGDDTTKFQPSKGNGQADLKDGVADVKKLWLENRVLRIGFQGEVKYAAHEIDGRMVVQALTAADQIIHNLPLVRDIVLDGGKSLIPLWFRIEGPWADPKTRPMPLKSIEAPFLRIFKGLIDLPQDLYDKVTGK